MMVAIKALVRDKIKLICFFGLYSLIFYLPSILIIGKGATVVGAENTHWSLACNMLCMALGFLSYPLSRRIFTTIQARRRAFLVLGALLLGYIFLLIGPLRTSNMLYYLLMLGGEAFLMGHLSGHVFYYMAISLQGSPYLGRVFGLALAVGVVFQNMLQQCMTQVLENAALTLAVTIIGMMVVLWRSPHDMVFDNALPYEKAPPVLPQRGLLGVLTIVLLTLLGGFIDCHLTYLNAHGILDEAAWPRLFFAIGLVVAGFFADLHKHRYLSLATVGAAVMCIPALALLLYTSAYNVVLCLNYGFSGFFVLYIMVFFMELAPKTQDPALWVVMGRIVYSLVNGLLLLGAPQLRQFVSGSGLLLLDALLVVALFVICYQQSQPQLVLATPKEKVALVPLTPLESFSATYGFTPRETEVFELLTDDGLTIQDIADRLFISRRVCQRYLTSMYEKTETKTRLNLLLKYYRGDRREESPSTGVLPETDVAYLK